MADKPDRSVQALAQASSEAPTHAQAVQEDSDPDFDDLDDVLDQFSSSQPTKPTPTASGPGRPEDHRLDSAAAVTLSQAAGPSQQTNDDASKPAQTSQSESESEAAFLAQLNTEMAALISSIPKEVSSVSTGPTTSSSTAAPTSTADLLAAGKELDAFTERMEREGVKPEDLLRAILGEETGNEVVDKALQEHDKLISSAEKSDSKPSEKEKATTSSKTTGQSIKGKTSNAASSSFEDTIRATMARISSSDTSATSAANISSTSKDGDGDMFAKLLKALDTPNPDATGDGDDEDLSKMFLGMMEQLTHKDMLYEPMLELHQKFPAYLSDNAAKLGAEDKKRFENQSRIVGEIVGKFEEKGYSDDDPECREFVWDRMQRMQEEGSPPEELLAGPMGGLGAGGLGDFLGGGLGGGTAGGAGGEEGCPTQ